jgi:hypothetical protein
MRQVIISFDENGNPYVVAAPKKIEVIFKEPKKQKKTFKKLWRTAIYKLKTAF